MKQLTILVLVLLFINSAYAQVKSFIYIDASDTKGLNNLYDKASAVITEVSIEGDYVLFISYDLAPIIVDQTMDLKEALNQLFVIRPAIPSPKYDLQMLDDYLKKKEIDADAKLYVFSSVYVLLTLNQLNTYYAKYMVILGYNLDDAQYYKNLSLYLSSLDASQNEQELANFYPYSINIY